MLKREGMLYYLRVIFEDIELLAKVLKAVLAKIAMNAIIRAREQRPPVIDRYSGSELTLSN